MEFSSVDESNYKRKKNNVYMHLHVFILICSLTLHVLIYIKTDDCQKACRKQEMSKSLNLFSKISAAISMDNEHNVSVCRVVDLSVALNTKR